MNEATIGAAYNRGEIAFFDDPATKRSIAQLASGDSLVIYCGAGVTIDHTDLGWGDLIYKVLRSQIGHESSDHLTEQEATSLRQSLSPLELASVTVQYVENAEPDRDATKAIVPQLQQMLYEKAGWQTGALVRNVIRLAAGLSVLPGKRVEIITSNYDVYLEQAYDEYWRDAIKEKAPDVAGLIVRTLGTDKPRRNKKSKGTASQIELFYIHGRVQREGRATGKLALSESDYHALYPDVTGKLKESFKNGNLLIIGSSLTDSPLLAALSASKPEITGHGQGRSKESPTRVALVPATSTNLSLSGARVFPRLKKHLNARMTQFGVDMLVPDFHLQIAQYCQEVLTCAGLGKSYESYASARPVSRATYSKRLESWWQHWKDDSAATNSNHMHGELAKYLETLRNDFLDPDRGAREEYKLELWVRDHPDERRLVLWGTSAGVITDRTILKWEPLGLDTDHVAVRAFVEGRPLWLSRDDLDDPEMRPQRRRWIEAIRGRWCRYLAVPIRVEADQLHLQAGVVLLAAMNGGNMQVPADTQITRVPLGRAQDMRELVDALRALGRQMLAP